MKKYPHAQRINIWSCGSYLWAWLCLLGLAWAFQVNAAPTHPLRGHVPPAAQGRQPIGRLDPASRLRLAIGLPLRNSDGLTNLLKELYDPQSPRFHQFLTPDQFAEAFAPSEEQYAALLEFARTNRLEVTSTHANRVLLDVKGSVADIEKAFGLRLLTFRHPTENRDFFAPDQEPSVTVAVPILDISGLDDFSPPHPLVHRPTRLNSQPQPFFGSGSGGTYLGKDFRAAYAPNVAVTGLGQTVGLLEFDGYYANDIASYESLAGLPNVPLTNVLLDGYNGTPGGNNVEVALDIEMAVAMAPGLSRIVVYEAGPSGFPNDILNRMASDNSAKQLSSSWSWSGGPSSTTDNIFLQFAAQGQSYFQAAGDSDAYSGAAPQPCDNPNITIVGGTTLSTSGPGGTWASEKTWNWYNSGNGTNGTGGGISTSYTIPSWQQSVSMAGNQGSTTMRNFPDVALTADNIFVTYNNGSSGAAGGTSCAAPLWAAYTALINQQALANGKPVVGFINPALYTLAQGSGYAAAMHDITSGNNTNASSPTKFLAVSGFDLCTGWGTPAGGALLSALAGAATPHIVSNSLALVIESCTNNAVDPGETLTVSFGLINTGSADTANLVATLQPTGGVTSPGGPQTYGVVPASGSAVTRSFSFTANGTCGSTLTATLQLQDGPANLGNVTFTVRLGATSVVTSFSENFDGVSSPGFPAGWSTSVASGVLANWASTNGFSDTAPNSVFAADAGTAGQTDLVSPPIAIVSSAAQLTFRHNYNLAFHSIAHPHTLTYYDGGVLQISIGGGAFSDIVTAGGSFSSGGYNCTLSAGTANPLAGAAAWGSNSMGWVTTTVVLPAAAAGQNVQLKWSLATGINSFVGMGWFLDSVSIQDNQYDCCAPTADVAVNQSAAPNPVAVGQNLSYTITVSNLGPSTASNLAITDALPSNVTFVSASPGCVNLGNAVACVVGALSVGHASNIVVTIQPSAAGTLSNTVTATSNPADPNLGNDLSVSLVSAAVAPSITAQPTNQVAVMGSSASFSVNASGSVPLSYLWTFGGNPLAGATVSSLSLTNVQPNQAGNYAVVVTNSVGSVTSTVATLTVLIPPSITGQPTNQTVSLGSNTVFQVGATGTAPLSFQWMFAGAPLSGATSSSVALTGVQTNQAGNYCVVVTNSAGAVTSSVATLTVLVPPAITLQPASQSVVLGSNVTFQAAASGSAPLNYQWFFGGAVIPGQTGTALGLTNVQTAQAGNYQFVASNGAGSATSTVAQLTVLIPPAITTQPTNQTVISGANLSFQVNASGTAPLSYQWWFNGTNALGTSTNILGLNNVQPSQAGAYNVVITNSAGAITSSVATLTVGIPPGITNPPTSLVIIQGQNASFNVAASGDAPLGYQWRFASTPVAGATASSYTVFGTSSANAGNYDVVVSNPYGAVTSSVAQLTVLVPPSISSQPTNQIVAAGTDALFQVLASGTAPLSYQWWFNGTNAVGINSNALVITGAQAAQAGTYQVVITNSAGAITSAVATLSIGVPAGVSQQPVSLTVIQGRSATFTVMGSGTAPISYQWRLNGVALPGGVGTNYFIGAVGTGDAGAYDAVISNAYGSITSAVGQLTVVVPPSISAQPTNQTVSAGSNVMFQVSATGSSPLAYQWWFNNTNVVGGNTNVLCLTNVQVTAAGGYSVVVTNTAGFVTSLVATLVVGIPPTVTQDPGSLTVTQGQNAGFSVSADGTTPLTYQWRFNGTPLAGGAGTNYIVSQAASGNAGSYDVVITNSFGVVTSALAQLTVIIPPSINVQPTNQTVISGASAAFQVSAAGTAPFAYQWWFNGTNAVGANSNLLAINNAQVSAGGSYSVVVANAAGSITSAVAQLIVLVPPTILTQPSNQVSLVGGTVSFYAAAAGSGPLSYQWSFNGSPLTGATTNGLQLTSVQLSQAGSYALLVSNAAGTNVSTPASLKILVPPLAQNAVASPSGFSLSVSSVSGLNYLLEYKNALTDSSWTPAGNWTVGTGGILVLPDTNSPTGSRFYRVRTD
ncbi:MAG TPA: immunoglobulin domain-containing protein [Verrucomicrobiae bacterium]|nr:immunoglobulin domain-containing protein [Verrucomicrobiae bacterium]